MDNRGGFPDSGTRGSNGLNAPQALHIGEPDADFTNDAGTSVRPHYQQAFVSCKMFQRTSLFQ